MPHRSPRAPLVPMLALTAFLAMVAGGPAAGGDQPGPAADAQQPPPSGAQQASPTPAPPPQPTGTGRITVRLVAADTGAAVKRARVMVVGTVAPARRPPEGSFVSTVTLEASPGVAALVTSTQPPARDGFAARMVRQEGETDETGACTFTQLPPATYSISVMPRSGFVPPSGGLESVPLEDGGAETVTVRLARTGAIVGRILDESGDPVTRAQVRALRLTSRGSVGMTASASTDDLGQFRLFDLQPGDYYVAAEVMPTSPMMAPPAPGSGPRVGLAPTYYPGSPALDGARSVKVRSGEDTGGVEFSLVRAPLGTVSGRAYDSQGNPLTPVQGVGVSVQLTSRGQFHGMGRGASVQPDGSFIVRGVPPGDYYLSASLYRQQGSREGGFVPVTVNGDDVTVDVRTNTGATVSGRIVFEGEPPAAGPSAVLLNGAPAPRVSISARPATNGVQIPGMSFGTGSPTVRDDNTFELTGLRGTVALTAFAGSAVFKSLLRGGQDITGKPFELTGTEMIDDLVLVLSYETGSLEGIVANGQADSRPERTMVVVFPDDPARWFEASPFVRTSPVMTERELSRRPPRPSPTPSAPPGSAQPLTPAQEALRWSPVPGGFFLPRLLPGRYLVAVVDPRVSPMSFDAEALERLKARAVFVRVNAAQRSKVQVSAPVPESRLP